MRTTFFLIVLLFLAGCGGDEVDAFSLRLLPRDVVESAVDSIEIVIKPTELNQRFVDEPDQSFDDNVSARVTAAGEFAIFVERGFIEDNAEDGPFTFNLRLPLYALSNADPPEIGDPQVTVTIIRREERIAIGQRLLPWPLPPGGNGDVTISCVPEFGIQCTNNDPATPSGDAGM